MVGIMHASPVLETDFEGDAGRNRRDEPELSEDVLRPSAGGTSGEPPALGSELETPSQAIHS